MYNLEIEKKQRRKVVAIASATVALILLLIVAIVVVATSKSSRQNIGGDNNGSFSIVESEKAEEKAEAKTEEKKEEKPATVAESSKPQAAATPATATSKMPSTGPEDLMPLAVLLGGLTTAGTAVLVKRK